MAQLLQCVRLTPALEAGLAQRHQVCRLFEQPDPATFLRQEGGGFTAAVTSAAQGLPAGALGALPKLRVISSFGVGTDRLPLAEARARGIAVGFTPDVLNECVADMAFALLLDVARGLSAADRYVRRGEWPSGPPTLGRRVHGARLGVVGMGRIGQAMARRAVGFEMPVRYHTPAARRNCPGRMNPPCWPWPSGLTSWC
nr:NAD(P)-dependent oxidoreductase [Ideonella sp. B508-1]